MITIRGLSIGYRGPPLLDGVSCQIQPAQRIGLLGRNGAGKTTFLRILSGQETADHGEVQFAPSTKVALLSQDVPRDLKGRVFDIVAESLRTQAEGHEDAPWKSEQQVEQLLTRMNLDGTSEIDVLSSGMKRRVLLARALVSQPDLLLLDEPTNHLDIVAIEWLEAFLLKWSKTFIFVTHDRMFLRRLATRILEIDGGRLYDWSCDYDTFLQRKEAAQAAQETQDALFQKKLAQEEAWIRQGIKARRTRNEGRVRALKELRRQHQLRRKESGQLRMRIQAAERSGNLVAKVEGVSFAYDDVPIVREFSTTIMRGDKVGIIGPNGAGKSTLLKILLGRLTPQAGSVRLGTNLKFAYFDQLREQLDDEATVQENVGEGSDTVAVGGRSQHVIGYLQDFLFTAERARTPVRFLSGGERNRILLAKLFAKPANVLVLDEPTNDLDSETLELLEQRLVEFTGTVLLVSHDRAFLNNVVTNSIVFEDQGLKEYDGGYDDWVRQRTADKTEGNAAPAKPATKPKPHAAGPSKGLSFKQKQELAALPATIEKLETEMSSLHQAMAQADFFRQPSDQIATAQKRLRELEDELATAFERWESLEALSG